MVARPCANQLEGRRYKTLAPRHIENKDTQDRLLIFGASRGRRQAERKAVLISGTVKLSCSFVSEAHIENPEDTAVPPRLVFVQVQELIRARPPRQPQAQSIS